MHNGRGMAAVSSSAARVCGQKRLGVANNGRSNPMVEPGGDNAVQAKK